MLARISVKKPYTVIVGIILVIALGVISFRNMTTDLLPSMDLPYVIVYTTYTGATPERVESDVTRPMEESFATLSDIKNISSTSSENLSLVVLEFAGGANMDTAMIEISSDLDQLSGGWGDDIGTPVIMKLNPNMLPVMVSTVSLENADHLALSDYVEDELMAEFEGVDGVARVSASGILTQQVDITIEQSRIDALNSAILAEVDGELAEVETQLRDAMGQLSSGKGQLSRMKRSTYAQIDEAIAAIDQGTMIMPAAIAGIEAQKAELTAQLDGANAALAQLEALVNMTDEEKAQLKLVADQISALEAQRDQLQQQLDNMEEGDNSALEQQLSDARKAREEQAALKASQEKYIEDLLLLDADALKATISSLEGEIAANEAEISAVRSELEAAIVLRNGLQADITDLQNRIAALEPTDAPTEAPATAAPTEAVTATPAAEATATAAADSTATAEVTDAPETTAPAADATDAPATQDPAAASITDAPTEAPASTEVPVNDAPKEPIPVDETEAPVSGEGEALAHAGFFGAAYAEGETLEELKELLAAAETAYADAQQQVNTLSARHDSLRETLNSQAAALQEAKDSLALIENEEITVQGRIEAAQAQIAACDRRIAELDAEIASIQQQIEAENGRQTLSAQIDQLNLQISAIKESDAYKAYLAIADNSALNEQYAQAQAAVSQLTAAIAQMDGMLVKLNSGILPGGMIEGMDEDTDLAAARTQLTDARAKARSGFAEASSAINSAEAELAEAWDEFVKNRDEALENAGIDGIITVQTVSAILGSQNLDLPAGYVSDAEGRYLVSVGTEFKSLSELKQVKLFSLGLESVDDVRLLDVANVEINDNSEDLFTLVNGENGVMLSFEKQSTASTAEVTENIAEKNAELMAENPDLKIVEMMNQGDYINLVVDSVLENLMYGAALAIIVLLLFLMDWRPTLIVAISIPVSVVIAFVCMYFSGITLNIMSLSGLALAVGMLVDNSIVSIDNIYRLRDEEGLPIIAASIKGVNEVAGALVSSTLTTICVFLPVVFVTGMARDLFGDMGLTIAFALIASLITAMTVVPSMAAGLFKKKKVRKQRVFKAFQKGYVALLKGALKVKWLVLLLAVGLLVFSVMQIKDMPISFMPTVNSTQMSASLNFNESELTEDQQQAVALEIMQRMQDIEGVNDISVTGSSGLSLTGSMSGGGYSYYVLVEEGLRTNADVAADMRACAAEFADGEEVVFSVQESTMDLSAMAGSGISISISGSEIDDLRQAASEVAALCAQVEGAENIDDGSGQTEPKLMITVDKEAASDNSLSVAQVYQYIAQRLYGSAKLTDATLDSRNYTLYVSEDKNQNLTPEDIEDMEIEVAGTNKTWFVRIGDIADISEGETLASISRSNQRRNVTVSFAIADGYSASFVSRDLEALLENYTAPGDCDISLGGENETVMELMGDLILMVGIAILFIFLIMVAQFQSFKSPIIVMFTIPLAFTGGLLALMITGLDLSIIAMVGFLVLSGVVVNNGIVFIDGINQLRIGGMEKKEAIIETGRRRLRPILMTALTTILGMGTIAFAKGMGAEMMQPMAVVTIGGLSYATLMTLFVVPALYDIFNG